MLYLFFLAINIPSKKSLKSVPILRYITTLLEKCVCPFGKDELGSSCVARCESNELLDKNGNWYSCGQNMAISNSCICAIGYVQVGCRGCKISCKSNEFQFMGMCALFPMSKIYLKDINGCAS
jgi:hypothetical protein